MLPQLCGVAGTFATSSLEESIPALSAGAHLYPASGHITLRIGSIYSWQGLQEGLHTLWLTGPFSQQCWFRAERKYLAISFLRKLGSARCLCTISCTLTGGEEDVEQSRRPSVITWLTCFPSLRAVFSIVCWARGGNFVPPCGSLPQGSREHVPPPCQYATSQRPPSQWPWMQCGVYCNN